MTTRYESGMNLEALPVGTVVTAEPGLIEGPDAPPAPNGWHRRWSDGVYRYETVIGQLEPVFDSNGDECGYRATETH